MATIIYETREDHTVWSSFDGEDWKLVWPARSVWAGACWIVEPDYGRAEQWRRKHAGIVPDVTPEPTEGED